MRKLQDCNLVILLGRYERESILMAIIEAGLEAAENTLDEEHALPGTGSHSPCVCL